MFQHHQPHNRPGGLVELLHSAIAWGKGENKNTEATIYSSLLGMRKWKIQRKE